MYAIATPTTATWHHYVNLAMIAQSLPSVRLDGVAVDRRTFQTVPDSIFAVGTLQLTAGRHVLESDEPFGLIQYGWGTGTRADDAYGNAGTYLARRRDGIPLPARESNSR